MDGDSEEEKIPFWEAVGPFSSYGETAGVVLMWAGPSPRGVLGNVGASGTVLTGTGTRMGSLCGGLARATSVRNRGWGLGEQ